jgi:hypothetical protein
MIRLQNIDLVEIAINSATNAVFLPDDRIFSKKKIKRLFIFSDTKTPSSPLGLPTIPAGLIPFIYLDIYNSEKEQVFKDVSASLLSPFINSEFLINSTIDFSLSEITIQSNAVLVPGSIYSLLIGIEYQTKNLDPFADPDNMQTIIVDPIVGAARYDLKQYINYSLTGRKIHRIVTEGDTTGFFVLREKSGKQLQQIPTATFEAFATSENLYIDAFDVDFENSYIEQPNALINFLKITFYYE